MNIKAIALVPSCLLAACVTTPTGPSEAAVQTGVGQMGMIGDIGVTPVQVTEDSRCPVNVQCVTAGRVVVTTQLTSPTGNSTQDIVLGRPVSFAGGMVTLSEVLPDRVEALYPAQADYQLYYTYTQGANNAGYGGY